MSIMLLFVSCIFPVSAYAEAGTASIQVKGQIVNVGVGAKCLLQLRRPIWLEVAKERSIDGRFSVTFSYQPDDDGVIVSVTCNGYSVYVSKSIQPGHHVLNIGLLDGRKRLDVDGCRELVGKVGEKVSSLLTSAFVSKHILSLDKVTVSRPRECKDSVYVIIEAIGEASGPGQHWSVTREKSSGEITVEQGI